MLIRILLIISTLLLFLGCDEKTLFFDDFENYSTGEFTSKVWEKSGNGKVFVDDSKSVSGKKSLHFITDETYKNRAFISFSDKNIFPLKKNKYYGEMQMFVEEASPDGVHWTMLQSSGRVPKKNFIAEIRYGGQHNKKLMANYETNGIKSDCWQHSDLKIPEKKWFKVGWFFDGNKNLMKLWINDVLVKDLIVKDRGEGCVSNELKGNWIFPIFENIEIGWVDYQSGGGKRNVWIDDFKLFKEIPKNLKN